MLLFMVSNEKSLAEEELQKWLENNSAFFLDASEQIEKVVFLSGTINSDPRASTMEIEFDHKYYNHLHH